MGAGQVSCCSKPPMTMSSSVSSHRSWKVLPDDEEEEEVEDFEPAREGSKPVVQGRISAVDDGRRRSKSTVERLKELEQYYDDLLEARERANLPCGWVPTARLASSLLTSSKVAPMRLLPFNTLRQALKAGSVGFLTHGTSTIDVQDLPSSGRVLFLSHRWWSSRRGEPDRADRGWPKAKAVTEILVPMLAEKYSCRPTDFYIWWDYFSVDQQDPKVRLRQLECIPIFVAMSDVVVACRAGDEDYNEAEPFGVKMRDHPGHYNNRVWTMCELFMATSDFQRSVRGDSMSVYSFEFDADMRVVHGPDDQTAVLRSQFHEMHAWSLPPRENLVNKEDLSSLEPLIVILGSRNMPRLVKAARFGLRIAVDTFLSTEDINAPDPATGERALHAAARAVDYHMVTRFLAAPHVDLNAQSKAGQTPLHLLVSSGVFDHRCDPEARRACVHMLVGAGADPSLKDARGRSAVDVAVSRFGLDEAARLFPQHLDGIGFCQAMSFKPAFRPEVASEIELTTGERSFEDGSVVHWRRVAPVRRRAQERELVVCFPSGAASSWLYVEWAYRVAASQGYEVIMVDNPGTGHSTFRPSRMRTVVEAKAAFGKMSTTEEIMNEYCRDIEATFIEEGWANRGAHLVGTSFGCVMAAHLALKHPSWCRSLTLFGWPHSYRHTPEVRQNLNGICQHFTDLYLAGDVVEFDKAMSGFVSASTETYLRELFLHSCRPGGDNNKENGAMNLLSLVLYADLQNVLPLSALSAPTLVVMGEADAMFMDHGFEFGRLVPHSRLVLVPRVGHVAPAENPVDSHDIVVEFLASVAGGHTADDALARTLTTLSLPPSPIPSPKATGRKCEL